MNTQLPSQQPSQTSIVQQTTVIQVGAAKSIALAVILALLFGPLGMLYATIPGAIVMFFVNLLIGIPTLGLGLLLTVPIGAVWAGIAASSHNKGLGMSAQSVAMPAMQPPPAAQTPAGWYPDPDGGKRQRYWDGHQWTDHYHEPEPAAKPGEPVKIEAGAAAGGPERLVISFPTEGSHAITCGFCGNELGAEHQFCHSCGAPRSTAEAATSES